MGDQGVLRPDRELALRRGGGCAPADLRGHPQVLPRQDGGVPDVEVEVLADESERGGEEAVPLGASTTTTTTTTDANFSTNPRRVRGRGSLRAQSTPTRSSMCTTPSWSWRSWILETCPCRPLNRELRSRPAVEKTTIARGSFQWIPEIVVLQRSPLWLVNREHSVSLSFKRAAHSNG